MPVICLSVAVVPMNSSNRLIDKKELSAVERWEVPNVGSAENAAVRPMTAEQLEAIQKEAYEEAYRQGQEAGRKAGHEEGLAEARTQTQRLEQVLHALAEPLEDVDEQVLEEMTALVIAIARQLIRRELHSSPDEIVAVVRESLAALPSSAQNIRVYLHPDDHALIRQTLSMEGGEAQHWQLVDDPVMTRGGCRVESATSRIDATVEKRLNAVAAELLGGGRGDDSSSE